MGQCQLADRRLWQHADRAHR
ncbi:MULTISPECIES: hypothetical protein [unclassified Xanthomonas]|nr:MULTISPECIES: hypothetical protein [unclassified Xanthomonas]